MVENLKSVLIVDDDVDLCTLTKSMVESFGYQAYVAYDGEQAIQAFVEKKSDLILLDVKMPKKDGYETFSALKEINSNVKVIFMTAFKDLSKWNEAKSNGAIYMIEKPYSMEFLKKMIDQYV